MPCQERHAMLRAAPGRRFATHRVDKLRRRAEVSPSSASSLSVRCRAEVIIAHTPSTLFTYETPTLIVEKSIARLALGSADNLVPMLQDKRAEEEETEGEALGLST